MICNISTGATSGICKNPSCLTSGNCICGTTPSPTPSSTPTSQCQVCQYQTDLFYGPVINTFGGGDDYYNTGRLLSTRTNFNSTTPKCTLVAVTPQPAPSLTPMSTECSDPINKGYFQTVGPGGFTNISKINPPDGYVTSTFKNVSQNCSYTFGLATYKAYGSSGPIIKTQNIYDYSSKVINPGETITLRAKIPMINDNPACHNLPQ